MDTQTPILVQLYIIVVLAVLTTAIAHLITCQGEEGAGKTTVTKIGFAIPILVGLEIGLLWFGFGLLLVLSGIAWLMIDSNGTAITAFVTEHWEAWFLDEETKRIRHAERQTQQVLDHLLKRYEHEMDEIRHKRPHP